jgi:RecA/RadA recombinase
MSKKQIEKTDDIVESLHDALTSPSVVQAVDPASRLSSGCTLLNLACTNDPNGFLDKGDYLWLCGASNAGKTWLLMTMLAEAANSDAYKDYRLIYDDVENGCLMDVEQYFGKKLQSRLEPPRRDKDGNSIYSEKVEDFYFHLDDVIKTKKPFIYILDSMDSLDSIDAQEKFEKNKDIRRGNEKKGTSEDLKGSYGDGKAKMNSQNIRRVITQLRNTGSILVVVTQTRDNITGYGAPQVAGGGRALKFYAHVELWLKPIGDITKSVKGKLRSIGTQVEAKLKKNRHTGQRPDIQFTIYNSYGLDDIGSMIDWLLEEKIIKPEKTKAEEKIEEKTEEKTEGKAKNKVIAIPQLGIAASRDKLIQLIEIEDHVDELKKLVADSWNEILEKSRIVRKKRYE